MFDLVTGKAVHIPSTPATPIVVSTIVQLTAGTLLIAVPLLFATAQLPEVPDMLAFVAVAPPPPPPPPAPAPLQKAPATPSKPVPADTAVIPIEAPSRIEPEAAADEGPDEGVVGGVPGGVPGGIVGGVVGGLVSELPPPPPPPPAPRRPVRIGGDVQAPALVRRVEPEYPRIAADANLQGMVILEATVNEDGQVEEVRVLRSVNALLDKSAIAAVKQWQYSPLRLNGRATPFVLTVTLSFKLVQAK